MFKDISTDKIRNFCLVGGGSGGKTSLAEAILFTGGVTNRLGQVEEGNTICDYNNDEIERKISINMAVVSFEYKDKKLNMIDAPGYADFMGGAIAAIAVSDAAVLVIGADSDIGVGTEEIWENLVSYRKPVLVFANKIDKNNIDVDGVINMLENKFEVKVSPVVLPSESSDSNINLLTLKKITKSSGGKSVEEEIPEDDKRTQKYRDKLIDTIASCDDKLIEKYLDGQKIGEGELINGLKTGFKERKIIPLVCGSAVKCVSIEPLLNFIAEYFPAPSLAQDEHKNLFSGIIFKTTSEPGMGQMNFVRVYSGTLNSGVDIYNSTKQREERIGQLSYTQGKKRYDVNSLGPGDIGVMIKLKETRTNDIVVDEKLSKGKISSIRPIDFPNSSIDMAVYGKSKGEEEKVSNALLTAVLEDPTLKFKYNSETKEMIISGIGSLQLEVMISRIKARYGVGVELRAPRVAYKETIKGKSEVQGKYKKQSGGRGQYGDCWIRVEPLERGKGFEFVNKIFGGAIPRNYIPAVEKGVIEAMTGGVISGYPVVDVRVTLFDGSYHEVDSSDMAFKIAGAMALRKAIVQSKPCILEPVMNVEVIIPDEYMGSVMGDLNSRRGRVLGMDRDRKKQVIKAKVPVGEVSMYATDLRSLTKGAGKYQMSFSHYEELPSNISQALIDKYQKSKGEEE